MVSIGEGLRRLVVLGILSCPFRQRNRVWVWPKKRSGQEQSVAIPKN